MTRHPRAWRIAKWSALTFLVLLVLAIGATVFFAESWIKNAANGKGSSATGRTFAIDGPLDIQWNWTTPRVHMEKVRLGNAPDMDGDNMLEIGAIDFNIKIWQMLYGKLNMPDLTITDARLVLQKKDNDHKNWDFPALSKGKAVGTAVVPDNRREFPVIGNFTLKNSRLIYKDDIKKLDLDLALDTATGSSADNKQAIVVTGKGKLQDKIFELNAKGGSVAMLRKGGEDYPLDLSVTMGTTKVTVNGTFKDPIKMTGIDAALTVKGDNMADLFYLTAIPLPPTPPYDIAGQLKKDDKAFYFNDFKGKVGDSDLSGSLKDDVSGERGNITATLVSNYLDMDDLSGFIGVPPSTKKGEAAGAEQKQEAAKRAASPRLLPDVPINLDRLRAADMDIDFTAHKLHAPGYPLQSLKATILLNDGILKIDPLDLGIASGSMTGSLVLDGREQVPDVKTDIMLKKLALKDFFKDSRFEALSAGHFGGHIGLQGKGKSLADVMATSNGRLTLTMSGGAISLLIVEAAGLDVAEATGLILDKDKKTNIRCAVGDFKVTDGLLNSQVFVVDTGDTNFTGNARINMKSESINASIQSHPKDFSPLEIGTPILIDGTLKNPGIGIDVKEAGARGGVAAVLGTILTPLAAIIPFIETGVGKDSDCKTLISKAQGRSG